MRVLAWTLVWSCLLAGGAAAQEEPALFRIESIAVEGLKRASSDIVIGGSRLKTGREYGEQELREAVYRIKRLPFVLDAEFSLRKGSDRGLYVLVIRVEETKPVFLSLGAQTSIDPDPAFTGNRRKTVDTDFSASFGARQFVGSNGELFLSSDDDLELIDLGYTQYNLWGTGGFLSVGVTVDRDRVDRTYASSLNFGLPVRGSHSLLIEFDRYESSFLLSRAPEEIRQTSEIFQLASSWIYDTSDDPLFPSSGRRVRGTLSTYRDRTSRIEGSDFARFDTEAHAVEASSQAYYGLKPGQVLSWSLRGNVVELLESSFSTRRYSAGIGAGYAQDLWEVGRTRGWGDLRWGLDGSYTHFDYEQSVQGGVFELGAELLFRNAWGIARWRFVYQHESQR